LTLGCPEETPSTTGSGGDDTGGQPDTVQTDGFVDDKKDGEQPPDDVEADVTPDLCAAVDCPDGEVCYQGECIPVPACAPAATLASGSPIEGNTNDGTPALDGYTCNELGGADHSGAELVYQLTSGCSGQLTVKVTYQAAAGAQVLDLLVLSDCAADTCIAAARGDDAGVATVTLDTQADVTYFIAVEGANGAGGPYIVGAEVACCEQQCDGKNCGPDGCGGECGACLDNETCSAAGVCECAPACDGKVCGDDGCGAQCGTCEPPAACDDAGQCVCTPVCDDKLCGDDGCGGECGSCDDALACTDDSCVDGGCVNAVQSLFCLLDGACAPSGTVDPTNPCNTCQPAADQAAWTALADGEPCGGDNVCFEGACCDPAPACEEKECGDNACGGECGTCEDGFECSDDGLCNCVPDCDGKACGDNGCDASCGECGTGFACDETFQCACVPQCDTLECGDDTCGGSCGDCDDGLTCTDDSCDGGNCLFVAQAGFCAIAGACVTAGTGNPESACESCDPAQSSTLWSPLANGTGCGDDGVCFDGKCCEAQCDGKECGGNGCGGSCGDCEAGSACNAAGQCQCVPDCEGKVCGGDGCGGSCGGCDDQLSCTTDSCVDGACSSTLNAFFCLIDDACAPSGTVNPINACESCQPATTSTGWTTAEDGTSCGGTKVCFNGGCCDSDANCAGKSCGDDQCGGICGLCPVNQACDDDGQCLCIPQCAGKACGPDQCGSDCGTCDANSICTVDGTCQCIPDCTDKQCGDDGCGGGCGGCADDQICSPDGQCVCKPQCDGKTCGPDACGGSCGTCDAGSACDAEGQCSCVADCAGKICGDDGCGGSCGFCDAGDVCDADGACVCAPQCEGKVCGDDGCGGSCGTCDPGNACDAAGLCQCAPDCTDKVCGDDGCGGSCGDCAQNEICDDAGLCECVPDCTDKVCGGDGCAGSCGDCAVGEGCSAGACVSEGETCEAAFTVDSLPFNASGDTSDATADHFYGPGECPGELSGWGKASNDEVYAYTATADGDYRVTLLAPFDSNLYVVGDCADIATSCLGADDEIGNNKLEEVNVTLTAGEQIFVIVDGFGNSSDVSGPYTLDIQKLGDQCELPYVVGALPFSVNGDTSGVAHDYAYAAGECPPETGGWGNGAADEAYQFTAPADGDYDITLTGGFDSNLYVVSDCADVGGTCLAGDEEVGSGQVETVTVTLAADQVVFIIVDGWSGGAAGTYNLTVVATGGCTPQCAGKDCGDDGCGGSCGTCTGTDVCDAGGVCQCVPECTGKSCGDDGCGGSCGDCAVNETCDAGGQCQCVPECTGKTCGDDGCGGSCGDCAVNEACDAGGQCQCVPECTGKICGGDGCGGSCGTCPAGGSCDAVGQCVPLGDQCFNAFQIANLPFSATNDTATANPDYGYGVGECPPETGGWGAGSSDQVFALKAPFDGDYVFQLNGAFDSNLYVVTDCADIANSCVGGDEVPGSNQTEQVVLTLTKDTIYFVIVDGWNNGGNTTGTYTLDVFTVGDRCSHPFEVDATALPFTFQASTKPAGNDHGFGPGECAGENNGFGNGSSDQVFEFTPIADGDYTVKLKPNNFDSALYIITDCADAGASCMGADEEIGFALEELTVTLTAGTTYYVIVDGYTNLSDQSGSYNLGITSACSPDCTGKVCGDDGCGGSCGACDAVANEACNAAGTACLPEGDLCANAFAVGALPFLATGDTGGANPDYGYSAGVCAPETGGWGAGSNDQVYSFTPAADGDYVVALTGAYDANLYVVTDCADIDNTCVGGDEVPGSNLVEDVTISMTAGTTYFIVVDGWSNGSNASGTYSLEVFPLGDRCSNPFVVGALPYQATGDTTDASPDYSYGAGECAGEATGWGGASSDEAYQFTAPYDGTFKFTLTPSFDSNLYVVTDCGDVAGTCLAADEEIGGTAVEEIELPLTADQVVTIIVDGYSNFSDQQGAYTLDVIDSTCKPDCLDKTCGDDGCGGSCGTCVLPETCDASGSCVCAPDCAGKVCGDDGCGGVCGTCALDETCSADQALCEATQDGETCTNALPIAGVPFSGTGDTTGFNNDYGYSSGQCPGEGTWGNGAPDTAYSFTPTVDGTYDITLTGAGFDSTLYVVTDCTDIANTCLGADEDICSSCTESLSLDLTAGTTYFIIVDGFSNTSATNDGAYTLTVDLKGDTCADPFVVGAVPFSGTGDTTGFANDYGYSTGQCAGESTWGNGAPEQVWSFTPAADGTFDIELTGSGFDSNLYVVTDCADIATTCLGADEDICSSCTESLSLDLTAGTTYYIIVDGFSNSSITNDGAYTLTVTDAACVPACTGKICGDDGCGGTCAPGCGANEACSVDQTACECAPDCTGKVCGDDGCGGSCGDCAANEACSADQSVCVCTPDCTGKVCGDDGCGGSCGTCAATEVCSTDQAVCQAEGDTCQNAFTGSGTAYNATGDTTGFVNDYGYTAGQCPGESNWGNGAPDQVHAFTPTLDGSYDINLTGTGFDSNLYVVTDCADIGNSCLGADEDICSNCTESLTLDLTAGTTYYIIVDGFSNSSPTNDGAYTLDVTLKGDTCPNPFTVGALPFSGTGDTTGFANDYGYSSGQCAGEGTWGNGAPDQIWAFTPTADSTYNVELTGTAFDSNLYVVTDCADIATTCLGADEDICSNCTESLSLDLTAGTTYYIIVDGFSNSNINNDGAYTLAVTDAACVPECTGKVCGDDGCGGSCGTCGANEACSADQSVCECVPACTGKVCGDDGCGGVCGTCAANEACSADQSACECVPACTGKVCGDDGCGGSCGTCAPNEACSVDQSVCECVPACTGKVCGDDGCGGVCGTCAANEACSVDQSACECVPDCTGKVCGTDGCAGDCGTCPVGESCGPDQTACVAPNTGDTCAAPFTVGSIPFSGSADTTGFANDYGYSTGNCPGEGTWGNGAPEHAYSFTPTVSATYDIKLTGSGFDSNLYVVTDCADIANTCLGADDDICSNCTESLSLDLTAGTTYFIIVDGFSNSSITNDGVYTLTVDRRGDTCPNPFTVGALPFTGTGDTTGFNNDYGYSTGQCPGEGTWGNGAPDQIWAFTPAADGPYSIQLTGTGFDSNLYVVTDCDDIANTCLGADDDICSNCTENLSLDLLGGTTYYIVVDGFSNSSITNDGAYELTVCAPDCAGKVCGDDGCGGSCGSCAANEACSADQSVCECVPACTGKVCGDDGCGGSCGDCAANEACSADQSVCECVPACTGKVCGDDGCGGSCGACGADEVCSIDQSKCQTQGDTCQNPFVGAGLSYTATGDTTGFDNNYGYSTGQCPGEGTWGNGAPDHVHAFTPSVDGTYDIKLTGTAFDSNLYVVTDCADIANTCLGADDDICSNCTESLSLALTAGTTYYIVVDGFSNSSITNDGVYSLEVTRQGDLCANPFAVGALPFSGTGDTTGFGNDYGYSTGQCPGESTWGNGAPDQVWAFTPATDGKYKVDLTGSGFDSNLYVVSDCADIANTCLGADDDICSSCTESLTLDMLGGTTYYIVVDGFSNSNALNDGAYTLDVACAPDCAGKVCGADGCGGQCGICLPGTVCNAGQTACE